MTRKLQRRGGYVAALFSNLQRPREVAATALCGLFSVVATELRRPATSASITVATPPITLASIRLFAPTRLFNQRGVGRMRGVGRGLGVGVVLGVAVGVTVGVDEGVGVGVAVGETGIISYARISPL